MKDDARLRILTFTTLYPNPGEPLHGLFVQQRLERIAQHCDITVVAPVNVTQNRRAFWTVPQIDRRNGIPVFYPRFAVFPGLFKHWDGHLLFSQVIRQLKGSMSLEPYDLIDAHYAYPDGVAAQFLAEEMGKPFVISVRGSDIHVLAQFPKRRSLIQTMLQRAQAIIAVSSSLSQAVEALGVDPRRIHVIPNGVDSTLFFPRDRTVTRVEIGWPQDAHIILSVGRLAPIKGFDVLIRALRKLRDRLRKPVQCYIVGDGELRSPLQREICRLGLERDVFLSGPVPPQELSVWYSAADLFCLLSASEGCPNVVLEALACGTPVVATAVGGIPEMVNEPATGVLIKRRTEDEVAHHLERALNTSWDRAAITKSPLVRDWSQVATTQVRVFRSVVND